MPCSVDIILPDVRSWKNTVPAILVYEKYIKISILIFNLMAEKVKQGCYKKLNFIL